MIPLSVRVGGASISRRVDDLMFRKTVHGTAEIGFNFAADLTADEFDAYERVYVYDGTTADTIAEARLEEPGRTLDDQGQRWDASAIGEVARATDRAVSVIYVDSTFDGFEQTASTPASRSVGVSTVPTPGDTPGPDALVMQFSPGNPIGNGATAGMFYYRFANIGERIGGFGYDHWDGSTNSRYRDQALTRNSVTGGAWETARNTIWSATRDPITPASAGSQFTAGADILNLRIQRVAGGATVIRADNVWGAFVDVWVRGLLKDQHGTDITGAGTYSNGYVLAHEVVADMLGRGLLPYDADNAVIDASADHQFDQLSFVDGATVEQILAALMEMLPDYYWQVGPSDHFSGLPSFTWRRWPTTVRYELSVKGGVNLPGGDADRYNQVSVRWKDKREQAHTSVYTAGTTIAGVFVPPVPELDAQDLVREPEPIDLSDVTGSQANADQAALEFLLAHGTPPTAGTVTVADKAYDNDLGRYVQPYEIEPGHLGRVCELGSEAEDLFATARDGRSVFRIVGMTWTASENKAEVELDAPQRSDENLLAEQIAKREPKR